MPNKTYTSFHISYEVLVGNTQISCQHFSMECNGLCPFSICQPSICYMSVYVHVNVISFLYNLTNVWFLFYFQASRRYSGYISVHTQMRFIRNGMCVYICMLMWSQELHLTFKCSSDGSQYK